MEPRVADGPEGERAAVHTECDLLRQEREALRDGHRRAAAGHPPPPPAAFRLRRRAGPPWTAERDAAQRAFEADPARVARARALCRAGCATAAERLEADRALLLTERRLLDATRRSVAWGGRDAPAALRARPGRAAAGIIALALASGLALLWAPPGPAPREAALRRGPSDGGAGKPAPLPDDAGGNAAGRFGPAR